jgi:hypothetical protein
MQAVDAARNRIIASFCWRTPGRSCGSQPIKFELVETAKAFGAEVPTELQQRADGVID